MGKGKRGKNRKGAGQSREGMVEVGNPARLRELLQAAYQDSQAGNHPEVAEKCRQILAEQPDNVHALMLLGLAASGTGSPEDAISLLERVVALAPDWAVARVNLGTAFQRGGKRDKAIEQYQKAIELDPENVEARINLGNSYKKVENYVDALLAYRAALEIAPRWEAYSALSDVLVQLGYPEAAEEAALKALNLNPDAYEAYNNLGEIFSRQGKFEAARQAYTTAHAISGKSTPLWNRSFVEFRQGLLAEAYRDYEAGLALGRRVPVDFRVPWWDGVSSIKDKHLAIGLEQGLGDELVFATCYPDAAAAARALTITCDPRLAPAWQRLLPEAEVVPVTKEERQSREFALPEENPVPDLQVPAGTLPSIFRPALSSFSDTRPILIPDQELQEKWKGRVDELPPGLRVGVSWRSSKMTVKRSWSYIVPEEFAALLDVPGVTFVNLQYDADEADLQEMQELSGTNLHDWEDLDQYYELEQVIALINNLDLVISINNANSRIASALGKETWLMERDSKWNLGCSYVPFFSNTRVWRFLDYGDKKETVDAVKEAIKAKVATNRIT